jgi:hypothetical protein
MRINRQSGIALPAVLTIGAVAVVLLLVFNVTALNEMRTTRDVRVRNQLAQIADGLSDQARLTLLKDYTDSGKTVPAYLNLLRSRVQSGNPPRSDTIALGQGIEGRWEVRGVSPSRSKYAWVDLHATVRRGEESQTVVRRISFGDNPMFELAMLSETTNCMYCHLRVKGDVGSLEFLRPGWGTEGQSGQGSGSHYGGSQVYGDVYVAPCRYVNSSGQCLDRPAGQAGAQVIDTDGNNVTNDSLNLTGNPKTINGAKVSGEVRVNYRDNKLPKDSDGDGVPDFPPIARDVAELGADGAVSGGIIVQVNKGVKLSSLVSNRLSVGPVVEGNLVLIGTELNPIRIDRDIYVKGDVVIKGVVTGRGAIYAERNVYVAGNVTTKNPPDAPNTGICAGISNPDACAEKNIQAERDELRLAARGSTILGDYTERQIDGKLMPIDQIQSADFYRSQFGFYDGWRCYDKTTGDELMEKPKGSGNYFNVEGASVPSANRYCTAANRGSDSAPVPTDAYSYSFRPGSINPDGTFSTWIDDWFYKAQLLGTMNYNYNTWRSDLPEKGGGESQVAYRDRIRDMLLRTKAFANKGNAATSAATAIACKVAEITNGSNGCPRNPPSSGDIKDNLGNVIGYFTLSGRTLRVGYDPTESYETQITRLDAFVYSNWRIAGKISQQAAAFNGGMIAKEIGILAPGRIRGFLEGSRYNFLDNPNNAASDCGQPNDPYYVPGTEHCALTVNYDYRLRNGGYGFNLVRGVPGATIFWKLSDNPTDKVNP